MSLKTMPGFGKSRMSRMYVFSSSRVMWRRPPLAARPERRGQGAARERPDEDAFPVRELVRLGRVDDRAFGGDDVHRQHALSARNENPLPDRHPVWIREIVDPCELTMGDAVRLA